MERLLHVARLLWRGGGGGAAGGGPAAEDAVLGGVEGGGTTYVVTVARGSPTNVVASTEFPTTTPAATIARARSFLEEHGVDAVGVAHFGPIDLDPRSEGYGRVTSTPKPGWGGADVLGAFRDMGVPVGWNTDVQAAALGELRHGGHGDVHSCCYVTVGTGIGAGVVTAGRAVAGLTHPEAGHIPVRRHPDDAFAGSCPYHGDCLEGMASAGALAARAGCEPSGLAALPDSHQVWELAAYYLGQLCATLTLTVAPEVIVLGGGVLRRESLFPRVREHMLAMLNGYVPVAKVTDTPELYVRPSVHAAHASKALHAGSVGALELARIALEEARCNA